MKAPTSRSCPPHAALLHRVASLMTTEELPPAKVTFDVTTTGPEVNVDATGCEQVQNVVRRWAAALEFVVLELPVDTPQGFAGTSWKAAGYDGTGVWWNVTGTAPVAAVCEAVR